MKPKSSMKRFSGLLFCLAVATAAAIELPDNFPGDVPIAEYMQVTDVMVVRDNLKVGLRAPGKTVADVAGWFQSGRGKGI